VWSSALVLSCAQASAPAVSPPAAAAAPSVVRAPRPPPPAAVRACEDDTPQAHRAAVAAMGPEWVRRQQSDPEFVEGEVRFVVRVSDASSRDGVALVQRHSDARDGCEDRYVWLMRTARACGPDHVEVMPAAVDCCGVVPCQVDARTLTFRMISAISDRDLSRLRGLLHPTRPLTAIAGGVTASFTRATLNERVFHALGDWSWGQGALPPPRPCGAPVATAAPTERRCTAWAGGAAWQLTWVSDAQGMFLVSMRASVD
jgi:hypothetical protein